MIPEVRGSERSNYEMAQAKLADLLDNPEKHLPPDEYRAHILATAVAKQRAHLAMLEAWA